MDTRKFVYLLNDFDNESSQFATKRIVTVCHW